MPTIDPNHQFPVKLYEALVLLALHDEKGTNMGAYLEYNMAAAILAELLLTERLKLTGRKSDKVMVVDSAPTGDPVLDEALAKMVKKKRPSSLKNWVFSLARIGKLKHKIAAQLVADGIVKSDEKKMLWVFSRTVYPEVNPEPEREVREQMRALVLTESSSQPSNRPSAVNPKAAIMLALAKSTHLLKEVFSKVELKAYKKRINNVAKGEELGAMTEELMASVEAAVTVTVIMPAVLAATTAATTAAASSSNC